MAVSKETLCANTREWSFRSASEDIALYRRLLRRRHRAWYTSWQLTVPAECIMIILLLISRSYEYILECNVIIIYCSRPRQITVMAGERRLRRHRVVVKLVFYRIPRAVRTRNQQQYKIMYNYRYIYILNTLPRWRS